MTAGVAEPRALDPTQNVVDLIAAGQRRQDDLRELEATHMREIVELRAGYDQRLREAETARIDAIRSVDVGAVNRAAEVAAAQAMTLAAQVANSAEALRGQVTAAATASQVALAAALEPIVKDIADLRRVQYESVGQKTQVVEARAGGLDDRGKVALVISIVLGLLTLILGILAVIGFTRGPAASALPSLIGALT